MIYRAHVKDPDLIWINRPCTRQLQALLKDQSHNGMVQVHHIDRDEFVECCGGADASEDDGHQLLEAKLDSDIELLSDFLFALSTTYILNAPVFDNLGEPSASEAEKTVDFVICQTLHSIDSLQEGLELFWRFWILKKDLLLALLSEFSKEHFIEIVAVFGQSNFGAIELLFVDNQHDIMKIWIRVVETHLLIDHLSKF